MSKDGQAEAPAAELIIVPPQEAIRWSACGEERVSAGFRLRPETEDIFQD